MNLTALWCGPSFGMILPLHSVESVPNIAVLLQPLRSWDWPVLELPATLSRNIRLNESASHQLT